MSRLLTSSSANSPAVAIRLNAMRRGQADQQHAEAAAEQAREHAFLRRALAQRSVQQHCRIGQDRQQVQQPAAAVERIEEAHHRFGQAGLARMVR
ncbi:hypothetical protein ACFJIW_17955 [Tahibacter sp. UC22_41]|uniref:hypothetical protein n=1 Tax=Tahibacter sp. UC22_41 TaxID=3350178 RepID=UPI0036DD57D7